MKKEQIRLDDWNRILFGEGPPTYLLEVVVRVAIVYLVILIAMRLMGKRLTAEVGRADLVATGYRWELPWGCLSSGLTVACWWRWRSWP